MPLTPENGLVRIINNKSGRTKLNWRRDRLVMLGFSDGMWSLYTERVKIFVKSKCRYKIHHETFVLILLLPRKVNMSALLPKPLLPKNQTSTISKNPVPTTKGQVPTKKKKKKKSKI